MRWLSKISLAALLKDTAIGRTRFQKGYGAAEKLAIDRLTAQVEQAFMLAADDNFYFVIPSEARGSNAD